MIIRPLFLTFLFFISFISTVVGQGDPQSALTSFEGRPFALFFFDDSEAAIYFDSETSLIHVSQDEGKSWSPAEEIPRNQAVLVIPHPFNNRIAFVLTAGTTHYRTTDRAKTWTPFELPVQPAFVARPLAFHSDNADYIIYQGRRCVSSPIGWGEICNDEAYYTKDGFANTELLLADIEQCQFAHSSKEWKHDAHKDLIYCVGYDSSTANGMHSAESSRLFSSTDFFETKKVEDLGIGKNAKGIIAFAVVSKFAVVALRDLSSSKGELLLYVTVDTVTWARAKFPHASSAQLRENAYTILESTTHSLAVDVVLHDSRGGAIGTLFVSNSNGTYFTQSLADTNRNDYGFVDFERVYGVEGVGLVNIVANANDVEARGSSKQLRTRITFNDGRTWSPLAPPSSEGDCDKSEEESCSLQLHSVTSPHNFGRIFSSPAPGLLMGVGAVASSLTPYRSSKTFLSTDAGVSWTKIKDAPHKYEFGDSGSIIVIVADEDDQPVDSVEYSLDFGKTFKTYRFGQRLSPKALLTVSDSTSQKFVLLGEVARKDQTSKVGEWVIVQLDFSHTRGRQCEGLEDVDRDFEKWYARPRDSECLMGRKQWYPRRKADVVCYVGHEFSDPAPHWEPCECTDEDYECDFNYVKSGKECIPMGPEPVPADYCLPDGNGKYFGSSGWRKIPGDQCFVPDGKKGKDEPIEKDCSMASPKEGQIIHQTYQFPDHIGQHGYFRQSKTILVRLDNGRLFQSSNEGYSWQEPLPDERFVGFIFHPHSHDRAYLITQTEKFYATTDSGRKWNPLKAPTPPNTFRSQILRFHPDTDKLIWTGNRNCGLGSPDCHAEAQYSLDNGGKWHVIESYVVNCAWAADTKLNADPTEIICESYRDKKGNQLLFDQGNNALELVEGKSYYKGKKKLFSRVAGFTKFSEYLVVAELREDQANTLQLQVSLDGVKFAEGQFPPSLDPHTHAYTVLESSTDSLFLHMTTSEPPFPYWGHLLKSNSNGTYFNVILENVNRNRGGYADFEKVIGLDGIALVNVVSNPQEAMLTGMKEIQSKITHNDGGSWRRLQPPKTDSLGNPYECNTINCYLNIHGYTERPDPRATYSSPSAMGLLMAVGSVGETLALYTSSDTFLSRDAGFTWTEVRKDAHLWEFGDSGSLIVLVNDEDVTDRILYTTDEGLSWREYVFTSSGEDKVRVWAIVTVYEDDSRKFILFGSYPRSQATVAIHVDFSALVNRKCKFDPNDPTHDDFEKWSPSSEREERCLFGKQTIYYRRQRDVNCVVGERPDVEPEVTICSCSDVDFECEFNHVRNENGECVLVPGTTPLKDDETCSDDGEYWYSRTAYRKIPMSKCEGGKRLDQGTPHTCPGLKHRSGWFWLFVITIPFAFTALVASWYYRKSGMARGTIRLPGDGSRHYSDGGIVDTLASVPWFLIGIAGIAWEWTISRIEGLQFGRSRRGYRDLPVDEDAHILRFEDEE